jgi:hypothetical protein
MEGYGNIALKQNEYGVKPKLLSFTLESSCSKLFFLEVQ